MSLEPGRREGGVTVAALRAFVAVVDAGGFSAAAQALGLSQPSVSAQVHNLEEACGVRLLHRRGRLELTEDGRTLLIRARLALARVDEFTRTAGDISALRSGRLVLGFSTPAFAMPLLGRFRAYHPAVEIATRIGNTGSLLVDLAECRADVAVMTVADVPAEFDTVLIARERLGLAVPVGGLLAGLAAVAIDDPAIGPLIQREPGSRTRALFEAARGGPHPNTLVVPSREALREAAAVGLGHGVLFEAELGRDPRLSFVPFGPPEVTGTVCAVCLREMRAVPAVAAFLALVDQALRQDAT